MAGNSLNRQLSVFAIAALVNVIMPG